MRKSILRCLSLLTFALIVSIAASEIGRRHPFTPNTWNQSIEIAWVLWQ
jgi:hypothetical protein